VTVVSWNDLVETKEFDRVACALSVGVFDGIHIGHRQLIRMVESHEDAQWRGVVTFSENPSRYVHGDSYDGDILTLRQRLERLDELGVDLVVLIDFTSEFRQIPGHRFLDLLSESVDLRYLTVGWNFHCGRNSDTSALEVARYLGGNGVRVDIAQAVLDNGVPVSSTRIRRAILRGDLDEAERIMVAAWTVDARDSEVACNGVGCLVRRGDVRQVLPPNGTYDRPLLLESGTVRAPFEVTSDGIFWKEQVPSNTA
jgi:riboflavin kinase/FMN adenylyltransferase